jgi:hypothetical protein
MASSARTTDAAAGPLSHWLAPALVDWLRAKGCLGITLLEGETPVGDSVAWQDAPASGWRMPIGDGRGAGVLLAFADRASLDVDELADVAALFERMRAFPLVHDARDAVLVDHAEARRLIHDLRNGLNTLMINATLLARVATTPTLEKSAGFVESAGAACADHLNRLSELTARPQGRAAQAPAPAPNSTL